MRSHEHTDILLKEFTEAELWDGYGLDCDVVVCLITILDNKARTY